MAVLSHRRVDERVDIGLYRDVQLAALRNATCTRDQRGGLLGAGLVDVGADDGGPGLGESGGDRAADAAPGPGHDSNRSGEVKRFRNSRHGPGA